MALSNEKGQVARPIRFPPRSEVLISKISSPPTVTTFHGPLGGICHRAIKRLYEQGALGLRATPQVTPNRSHRRYIWLR